MKVNKVTYNTSAFPEVLRNIASPPKQLFILGDNFAKLLKRPHVAIVGSRKISTYGRASSPSIVRFDNEAIKSWKSPAAFSILSWHYKKVSRMLMLN